MSTIESLQNRRSFYNIKKDIPVEKDKVVALVEKVTELVPDAFNMKSSRVVVLFGEKHDLLWNTIDDVFAGKVSREKIDGFKAGAGTVLYFYDECVVAKLQNQYSLYADNFPGWAVQSSAMLQLSIWTGLRELGIGASLQHYNPVIDAAVHKVFDIPESFKLVAQMPFGGICSEPEAKESEDISARVRVIG